MKSAVSLTKLGSLKTRGLSAASTKAETFSVGPSLAEMIGQLQDPPLLSNIPLVVTFDPTHGHISNSLQSSKFLLENVRPPLNNTKILVTYHRNRNLRDKLVRSDINTPNSLKNYPYTTTNQTTVDASVH